MEQTTTKGKDTFDFVIAFMGSVFLIYPAIKDVIENNGKAFMALFGSILFSGVLIGFFLYLSKHTKLFDKK